MSAATDLVHVGCSHEEPCTRCCLQAPSPPSTATTPTMKAITATAIAATITDPTRAAAGITKAGAAGAVAEVGAAAARAVVAGATSTTGDTMSHMRHPHRLAPTCPSGGQTTSLRARRHQAEVAVGAAEAGARRRMQRRRHMPMRAVTVRTRLLWLLTARLTRLCTARVTRLTRAMSRTAAGADVAGGAVGDVASAMGTPQRAHAAEMRQQQTQPSLTL